MYIQMKRLYFGGMPASQNVFDLTWVRTIFNETLDI